MRRGLGWASVALGCVLTVALTPAASPAAAPPGRITAHAQTLRKGCHAYRYHYVVDPPSSDWDLDVWLFDARGRKRGYGFFQAGADPENNRPTFTLCRTDVAAGRFTIKAKLRWFDDPALPGLPTTTHHALLGPVHFRMRA